MSNKETRQAALSRLVRERPVRNQQDIVRLLRRQGFQVTQASISRDMRELGLVKVNGRYVSMDRLNGDGSGVEDGLLGLITACEPVGANLIVVRTAVGAASVVGAKLDGQGFSDVVGTIAGDDTLFVAVKSRSAQGRVAAQLQLWIARH